MKEKDKITLKEINKLSLKLRDIVSLTYNKLLFVNGITIRILDVTQLDEVFRIKFCLLENGKEVRGWDNLTKLQKDYCHTVIGEFKKNGFQWDVNIEKDIYNYNVLIYNN